MVFCKNKKAFTLAEILIVLIVLGVISTLTIPALIQNIQDQQLRVAWKSAFANISQATKRALLDNGGSIKGICNNFDDNCLRDLYLKNMNFTKSCNSTENFGNCWNNLNDFWYLDGTPTDWSNNAGAILSNGMLIFIYNLSKNCTNPIGTIQTCGGLLVDVNGFKGPNRFGKDIFAMHILEYGVAPFGTQGDGLTHLCQGSTGVDSGYSCANQYLMQ